MNSATHDLPPVSRWMVWGFERYLERYFPKHFHALAVSHAQPLQVSIDEPLIVYSNHPSWWDPLVGVVVSRRLFGDRTFYAPMDAEALTRYPFLGRLGCYGVRQQSVRGAGEFLKATRQILAAPATAVWLTPEGRFNDVREKHVPLDRVAHLVASLNDVVLFPVAVEYPFWDERLPMALVRIGAPLRRSELRDVATKEQWKSTLHDALRQVQDELRELAIGRDDQPFDVLIRGRAGVSWFYDLWRRGGAWLGGRDYRSTHNEESR